MVETLEREVGNVVSVGEVSSQRRYAKEDNNYLGESNNGKYSIFAEMFLERPVDAQFGSMITAPSICTVKGIPTIDDW